jgi:uncharacterized membrane protein (UPF0127 family)
MKHFLHPLFSADIEHFVLRNERTGATVAAALETAFDSQSRRTGLLGRDGLPPSGALIIAPCNSIHTGFMRFAIDVLFVRRDGTVARVSQRVKPWRIAMAFAAFATIELPAGAIRLSGTRPGDQLRVIPDRGFSSSISVAEDLQPGIAADCLLSNSNT